MGAPVRLSGWRDLEAEQIWDWVALRQSFVQAEADGAQPHWLEDPLSARPVAAALRRACDVALASLLLAVLWPVIVSCMALVRLTSRGPALFRQRRIGYQCATFSMFKLRTMVNGAQVLEDRLSEAAGGTFLKIERDPRTTRVGRVLRKYSLDELPQLLNVLRGDMSLVGPRPLLLSDFQKFPKQEQMRRFSVRPGLTGLWQVSGRSATTEEQRIRLDLEYVERWSPWLDVTILAHTLPAVVRAKGAH
jgi:lipopolysaccharide/colanic/teichoic acid biosynthesis glycosyltransferase